MRSSLSESKFYADLRNLFLLAGDISQTAHSGFGGFERVQCVVVLVVLATVATAQLFLLVCHFDPVRVSRLRSLQPLVSAFSKIICIRASHELHALTRSLGTFLPYIARKGDRNTLIFEDRVQKGWFGEETAMVQSRALRRH